MLATFGERLRAAEVYTYVSRNSDGQRAHLADLHALDTDAEAVKAQAIAEGREVMANRMLAIQCAADCLAEELEMWLALRDDRPDAAWSHLIGAQEAAEALLRLGIDMGNADRRLLRLRVLEATMFPPQVFLSAGLIVQGADCTICGEDIETCDHIVGRAYWGKFAQMAPREVEPDHGALVTDPEDRRCRAIHFSDDGRRRNRMTWVASDQPLADQTFDGVLISFEGRWNRVRLRRGLLDGKVADIIGKPKRGEVREV